MFPWVCKEFLKLSDKDKDILSSESRFIYDNIGEKSTKEVWCSRIRFLLDKFSFLRADLQAAYLELVETNFLDTIPKSTLEYVQSYFLQFLSVSSLKEKSDLSTTPRRVRRISEVCQKVTNVVWYVLYHGRFGYVLGQLKEDYDSRYVVDVYKDGNLLKSGWSVEKNNQRIISVIRHEIPLESQTQVLEHEISLWRKNLLEEARKIKKETNKRVFIAINYLHGILPCVATEIDDDSYHFDVYKHGTCVQKNWIVGKSTKRQIQLEVL